MAWNYNSEQYDPNAGGLLPVGKYRVRIKEVCPKTSRTSGNDMWEVTLEISGRTGFMWDYIVFDDSNPKMTNQKLGQYFDSFGITPGNMDHMSWVGKVGGAKTKHEDYQGELKSKFHYLLKRAEVETLPSWVEPPRKEGDESGLNVSADYIPLAGSVPPPPDDEDLPF